MKQELTLIQPYPTRGFTIKQWYQKELENKSEKYIYMFYELEGKEYMKQVPYWEAKEIIDNL